MSAAVIRHPFEQWPPAYVCYKYSRQTHTAPDRAASPLPDLTEHKVPSVTSQPGEGGVVPGYDLRYSTHAVRRTHFRGRNSNDNKDNEDSHLNLPTHTNFRHFASVNRRRTEPQRMYQQTCPGQLPLTRAQNRRRTRSKNDSRPKH